MAHTLRRALRGRLHTPAIVTHSAEGTYELSGRSIDALTERQREVLRLIGKGHSNKEIALRLGLAEITIKQHVSRILSALGVSNRTQAAITARRIALIDPAGYDADVTAEASV
jgi:DNA-binding NarL/FixJ family response regulator